MAAASRSGRSLAWAVPIAAEAGAFGRSLAFAWMIGPEELGRAMILALTVRLVEMASDVGLDRLIVQAPDGDCPRLQAGLHGTAVARGVFSALILVALSPMLAGFFSDGPTTAAYAVLAFVPLVRGLAHLDFRRAERRFHYAKMALTEGGATVAMIAAIVPAALVLGDHRAMSVVLVAHVVAYVAISHWVASRRYAFQISWAVLRRSWSFGAPLILNAVLLFAIFYADRVIVARAYDWTALALYGVTLQLALLPAQIVGRAAASLVLPTLREALSGGGGDSVFRHIVVTHVLLGTGLALGFAVLAPFVIALVYGDAFRPDLMLAICVGLAAGFRVLRTPYSQLAIATGRTGDPARANMVRAVSLVPAAVIAAVGGPLWGIAAMAAFGEAAASLRAILLAKRTTVSQTPTEVFA